MTPINYCLWFLVSVKFERTEHYFHSQLKIFAPCLNGSNLATENSQSSSCFLYVFLDKPWAFFAFSYIYINLKVNIQVQVTCLSVYAYCVFAAVLTCFVLFGPWVFIVLLLYTYFLMLLECLNKSILLFLDTGVLLCCTKGLYRKILSEFPRIKNPVYVI
jgi:hypothetical protein